MTKQEEVVKGMGEILGEDLIVGSKTHENSPPGKDCEEECGVDIHDLIAASNPICSPMRSGGKKHRKCMDCWNEYIDNLILRLLTKQASLGGVIKVDRELPNDCIYRPPKQEEAYCDGRNTVIKAGYSAWEPLVDKQECKVNERITAV